MSSTDRDLVEKLARSGEEHAAPHAWQEQVWRRARAPEAAPPAQRRSFAWPLAGVAAMAVTLLLFAHVSKRQAQEAGRAKIAEAQMLQKRIEWEQRIEQTLSEIDALQVELQSAFSQLEAAQDEQARMASVRAERQARRQLVAAKEELARLRSSGIEKAKRDKKFKARKEKRLIGKCAKSNDPLCGM